MRGSRLIRVKAVLLSLTGITEIGKELLLHLFLFSSYKGLNSSDVFVSPLRSEVLMVGDAWRIVRGFLLRNALRIAALVVFNHIERVLL